VYDARGRLKQVVSTDALNNSVKSSYTLDKADNRSNKTTEYPPPEPASFAVYDGSVVEGGLLEFTVSRTATSASQSVNYATANGTATSPSNYTSVSGTLTFAVGETAKTVSVSTNNNSQQGLTKQFYLDLSGATGGAIISDSRGVGSIDDNDNGGTDCYTDPLGQIICS